MKISFFIKFFTIILMLLLTAIGAMVYQAFGIQNDIAISERHRYRSLLLAGELFQNSEDLTRMARTYVTTGNPVYKRHFFEILDIREGVKPRPLHYSATYWHLMDAGKDSVAEQGKAVSLLEIMDNEGFSDQEIALMREAKTNSDKLTRLEKQAIAALNGLYDDGHGNFVVHRAPNQEFAIELLFGERYVAGKAAIMAPIQQFTELINMRTQTKVNDELARLHQQILLVMVFIVMALFALVVTIFYTRRTLLRPLVQLRGQAIQLTQGDYTARCDIDTKNELAELGNTFNSMASAIERDVTALKLAEESMRQGTMVFENSSEAMMVTNADNIIISVNPAFTRVTGYTPDEVLGKNPGILDSGLHDEFFFQAIRTSLETTGHWEGEITGCRKNTEIYSEWRKVNAIYDEEGSVHRWITLFSDITLKKKTDELIWEQANFDSLTSLPNRYMFHNRLEQEIKKASRTGSSIALILLDLDHFKEVNDTYGHNIGDLLLKEAAWRLNSCIRGIDTVARLGGDEFTVILGGLNNTISINRVVRDILHKMAEPFRLGNEVAYVSASIGVTFYPQDASDMEALVRNGDQAMYAAKNQGRNCASYFTHTLHEAAQTRMRLASDLRGALAGGQFQLYYQPILELASGIVHKAEALLRWHHPKLGLVNPADFISIAEETRMIVDIGDWVFRTAVRQVKDWRRSHCAEFQISINTSPVQYRKDADLHKTWLEFLRELELPGQSLAIEITEGLLMDASPAVTSKLLAFRNAGVRVSMDDFGTGYSSLGYLKRFDIDYLKIDQSFVQSLSSDSNDLALCEAIIVMAHKLGIKVIAEGIETEEQRGLLALSGCDYGQGNLFSKPVPVDEFESLMQRTRKYPA
ncbi:GGDEF and EAL domain-containing protein [Nitrosospira sp. NpAV]|uniref:EAL domain-containing protein n=1 Tax=Nitrosospira sp. NpAV TaxID=58133 RepID=UPI000696C9CD|nr:GGDEF and EAL domain-containing protein [Nitrosospira sp. NpAV]